jgi:paraquat-inducible protein A
MTTDQLTSSFDNTILGGVILLIDMGSYPVAAVIFIASVLIPLGKLFMMFGLCFGVHRNHLTSRRQRTSLYRIIEFIGRWSMIDVFVVTVLVVLIQLGGVLRITPGPAAIAFGGMVIVTILAAESFDPRLIWDTRGDHDD